MVLLLQNANACFSVTQFCAFYPKYGMQYVRGLKETNETQVTQLVKIISNTRGNTQSTMEEELHTRNP